MDDSEEHRLGLKRERVVNVGPADPEKLLAMLAIIEDLFDLKTKDE